MHAFLWDVTDSQSELKAFKNCKMGSAYSLHDCVYSSVAVTTVVIILH